MTDNLNQRVAAETLERLFASVLAVFPQYGLTVITIGVPDNAFPLIRKPIARAAQTNGLMRFGRTMRSATIMGERRIVANLHWFAPPAYGNPDHFVEVKWSIVNRRTHERGTSGRLPWGLPLDRRQIARAWILSDLLQMFVSDEPQEASRGMGIWLIEPSKSGKTPLADYIDSSIPRVFSRWPADVSRQRNVRNAGLGLRMSTLRYFIFPEALVQLSDDALAAISA